MITFLITNHNVTVGRKWLWNCLLYIFVHVGQGCVNELWHQVWYFGSKFFRESIKNGSQLSFGCGCCADLVCIHTGMTEPHHIWFCSKPDHFYVRESSTRPVDPFPTGGTPNGRGVIIFDHLLTVSRFDSGLGVEPGRCQGRSYCNMKLFKDIGMSFFINLKWEVHIVSKLTSTSKAFYYSKHTVPWNTRIKSKPPCIIAVYCQFYCTVVKYGQMWKC